jgi:hypothetical protein
MEAIREGRNSLFIQLYIVMSKVVSVPKQHGTKEYRSLKAMLKEL